MFGFFANKSNDDDASKQFVRQMFVQRRDVCEVIAEAVLVSTGGKISFPVRDDTKFESSLAIMGMAFSVLEVGSPVMSAKRGARIVTSCKQSIENDYGLSIDLARSTNQTLDQYQSVFNQAIAAKSNPFDQAARLMLARCLGKEVVALYLPGTEIINPFTQQVISDAMGMMVTKNLTFWKGR